jgi:FkbM family methyltransferase
MNLIPKIARCTRWLQARFPKRSIKGLTRFVNLFRKYSYTGVITLEDGTHMLLDNYQSFERWLMFTGYDDLAVTELLERVTPRGGYCLDVGANVGFYTLKLAHWVGSTGSVASFEANPVLVERLKQNVKLNNFSHAEIVHAAVHDEPGELGFYISDSHGKSSLYPISDPREMITVKAITLDDYLGQWPRLDVIKMDIEGNDCLGLYGARQSIRRFRPFIVFEYRYNTERETAARLFNLLEELNYDIQVLGDMGRLSTFDWRHATGIGHIDIVGQPRS